jgi:hypothetical protein
VSNCRQLTLEAQCFQATALHFNFSQLILLIRPAWLLIPLADGHSGVWKLKVSRSPCLMPLLTYSMEQSPSWGANWFAASQEIPSVLWNPKVPHRTHKRPTPVPILSQPNPVHIPTSHFLNVHPNIILPASQPSHVASQPTPNLQPSTTQDSDVPCGKQR